MAILHAHTELLVAVFLGVILEFNQLPYKMTHRQDSKFFAAIMRFVKFANLSHYCCLSQTGTIPKRLNVESHKPLSTIAYGL